MDNSPSESRKRTADSSPLVSAPSKKQNLGASDNGEEGKKIQNPFEVTLLQYQNTNIKIRLQEKNTEINQLKQELKANESKLLRWDRSVVSIEKAWKQLTDSLRLTLTKVDSSTNISDLIPNFKEVKPTTFLELLFTPSKNENEEDEEVDIVLQKRLQETQNIVTKVVESLEREKSKADVLASVLRDNNSVDAKLKTLAEENLKLRQEQDKLRSNYDELHIKFKKTNDALNHLTQEKTKLQDKIEDMKEKVAKMKEESDASNHEYQKIKVNFDEEVRILKYQLQDALQKAASAPTTSSSQSPPPLIKQETTKEEIKTNLNSSTSSFDSEELSELKKIAQSRADVIDKLQEEKISLSVELQQLRREIANPSEDRIVKSRFFQVHVSRMLGLEYEIDKLKSQNDRLHKDIESLTSFYKEELQKQEETEEKKRTQLTREISELEIKVQSYKSERDSFAIKLEANKSPTNQQIVEEFRKLLGQKDIEIKKYKESISEFKSEINKLKQYKEDHKKGHEKIYETLDSKLAEIKELQNLVADRDKTIAELQSRRKKWEDRERQLSSQLETYKSNLSSEHRDHKELVASERRYRDENTHLKEAVEKLEKNQKLKELEEKYNEDILKVKQEYGAKIVKLERTVKEVKNVLETTKQERDSYISEVEVISREYENSQEQNTRILSQLADKEDSLAKLMTDQIRATHIEALLRQEKEAALETARLAEIKIRDMDELVKSYVKKVEFLNEQTRTQTEELKQNQLLVEGLKRSAHQNSQTLMEVRLQHEKTQTSLQEEQKRADEKEAALQREQKKQYKFDEEISTYRKRLQRRGMNPDDENDLLQAEHNRVLKKMVTCSVCNEREKSVVVGRCYHMFCRPCIEQNIANRHRKCPACGKPFDPSDVKNIYF